METANRTVDFDFAGRMRTAYCPAAAVFDIYDHFPGANGDIVGATGYLEPTRDGWDAACWLLAEFCRWGEILRRQRGEAPQPLLTVSELAVADVAEASRLRDVVSQTLRLAFVRFDPDPEPDEVDLVLQEIEAERKKAPPRGLLGRLTSRRRPGSGDSARPTP